MTYDEVEATRIKFRVADITARASRRAAGYRAVRYVLWLANSYPKSTVIEEAYKIRTRHTGVNWGKFRNLVEGLTGEKLC